MPNPRQTPTNAADSAPGVDDGRTGVRGGSSRSATPGRGIVWVLVALSLLALLAIFILRPTGTEPDPMAQTGAAQGSAEQAPVNPAAPPTRP